MLFKTVSDHTVTGMSWPRGLLLAQQADMILAKELLRSYFRTFKLFKLFY
jgi:hypothetical protein